MRDHLDRAIGLALFFLVVTTGYAQTVYDPVRFKVDEFIIEGDNPIGARANKVLEPFLGEQAGLEGLSAAADTLEQAIIGAGFSFHRVSLPPQELTSGKVEFNIISFSVGKVNISGNQFFDRENIEHSLPQLIEGETPNTSFLSRSLNIANNHASKNITLTFKESDLADAIDADIKVTDREPQIYFLTLDNTGSEETEEFRSTLGYQHGNLMNKDHALTATLTFSPEDVEATRQVGFNYHIPLYEQGANLDFLVSDSEVNSGVVGSDIDISGKGSVFGVSYSRPFLSGANFNHKWSVGLQHKLFENEIDLGGIPTTTDVLSLPIEAGYGFSRSLQNAIFAGGFSVALNIDSGSKNTDEDYDLVRTNAKSDWSLVKYSLSYDRVFAKEWRLHFELSGQHSDDLLISGEQFGVGGSNSLRGFEERSITGDKGYESSLELWMPAFSDINLLVFYDWASVDVLETNTTLNDDRSYDLSSAGFGLRWSWKQQLSISLDVGVIIEGLEENDVLNAAKNNPINLDDDTKAHFSLVYRF
ncbi:MAG: ShlB/FhaC/HecB family hemolysin secretion/activation protein [Gammaproteobacteria bacterium]|nr:ShlB/FhaC/HecB family hemolysin secretion/activation protein [Gammaproteobacteria bacterium]